MPHMIHPREDLDRLYPSLTAPDDLDDEGQQQHDNNDAILQHGMRIADTISQQAADQGRKRLMKAAEEDEIGFLHGLQCYEYGCSRLVCYPYAQ